MKKNRPICYAPFIGLFAKPHKNIYAPCCFSLQKNEHYTSVNDYWTHERTIETREKLLKGEWPKDCEYCKIRSGNIHNTDIPMWDSIYNNAEKIFGKLAIDPRNGNSSAYPIQIDYRSSNICNLKCRMCSPSNSTLIDAEVKNNKTLQEFLTPYKKFSSEDEFIEFLKKCNLYRIKFLGGEPTVDKKVIKLLEYLVETVPYEKRPQIHITTNGLSFNKKFRHILHNFSSVQIKFSLDAIEDTLEYIRTNSRWYKIKRNISWITSKYDFKYGFNTVLMPYNIFSLHNLLYYYADLKKSNVNLFVSFVNSDQSFTSINAILPHHMDEVVNNLSDLYHKNKDIRQIIGIDNLFNNLSLYQFNEKNHEDFIKYNSELDTIRKTKLIEIDNRFKQYQYDK